jgi:hypothetical protein
MSTTVQVIYDQVCFVLREPGGLSLGMFTEDQFLDIIGVVLLDFAQRAGLYKNVFTQQIVAGTAQYTVPDDVLKPELCFVAGRIVEKTTEPDLMNGHFQWRLADGPTEQWHEDNLPPKTIELFPIPITTGTPYTTINVPNGVYDAFNPADNNLTMFGPAAPDTQTWALGDTLQCIPDSFTPYLVYAVLEQVFSSESEMRDDQRALYCRTRWIEGLQLADAIGREELQEGDDDW